MCNLEYTAKGISVTYESVILAVQVLINDKVGIQMPQNAAHHTYQIQTNAQFFKFNLYATQITQNQIAT